MKNYEKRYEDVFTSERTLKKCEIGKVTLSGLSVEEYQLKLRDQFRKYELDVFDGLVKLVWLLQKFSYNGMTRGRVAEAHNNYLDGAFGVFTRHFIGYDHRVITRDDMINKVITYFYDFFPDFDINDPFKSKYEYPYKYMNFGCLIMVYQMPERLDLLDHGEKLGMNHTRFNDYVINYISCYNEEHGDTYRMNFPFTYVNYVIYGRKKT